MFPISPVALGLTVFAGIVAFIIGRQMASHKERAQNELEKIQISRFTNTTQYRVAAREVRIGAIVRLPGLISMALGALAVIYGLAGLLTKLH